MRFADYDKLSSGARDLIFRAYLSYWETRPKDKAPKTWYRWLTEDFIENWESLRGPKIKIQPKEKEKTIMENEKKDGIVHCENLRKHLHERLHKMGAVELLELRDAIDFLQKATKGEAEVLEEKRHGHPKFYEILEGLADLHSRKNHDYASGGDPLGNFKRRATFYSMYPGLDLSDPTVIALVDSMKQLDAALWFLSNKHKPMVEGKGDRLRDVAVYAVIAMVLEMEKEDRCAKASAASVSSLSTEV